MVGPEMLVEEPAIEPEEPEQVRDQIKELNAEIKAKQEEWAKAVEAIQKSEDFNILVLLRSLDATYLRQLSELIQEVKRLKEGEGAESTGN